MERFAHYRGWSIDAAPILVGRLFRASAVVERLIDGERFIFSDLGDRPTRDDAQLRALEWTRNWIDNNYRNEPVWRGGDTHRAAFPGK
ncbi:hypothetical protein [Paraburkholderia bannensis]|uniref:hypothetical protein n=1 Tax=Paraburkholderia bannensis TaxID=765414 RepID=UPI002AB75B3D|nr:hypothetical protein [Paraburkholderia bannensis]